MLFTICIAACALSLVSAGLACVAFLRSSKPHNAAESIERIEAHIVQLVEDVNELYKFREEDDGRIMRLGLRLDAVRGAMQCGENQIYSKIESLERQLPDAELKRPAISKKIQTYDQYADKLYSLDLRMKKAFAGIAQMGQDLETWRKLSNVKRVDYVKMSTRAESDCPVDCGDITDEQD
jgi:chromosome segregation ATPase